MVQRHNVVIPRDDGSVELHPLKEWLRQNPSEIPTGLDPTSSTSHQLRGALRRMGWSMQETPTEVRLVKPGVDPNSDVVAEVLGQTDASSAGSDETEDDDPRFSLEYQLRDFLASNLHTIDIDNIRLRLFVDAAGRDGVEFPTAVGPIDILAVGDNGSLFVFELKRANSSDRAIGQLARYMGWVRQTIGKDRQVRGVIVAKDISENLRYAASVVPNVHLFEYEVKFTLQPAHELQLLSGKALSEPAKE